ncbi:hypothetical protein GJ496_007850 [Pomphorhynchus laevis]|nr:hypothetical protein GJ496_007850 [Pomphorhynchus laevis]
MNSFVVVEFVNKAARSGNVQQISFFCTFRNIIQNYNPTERQLSDYLDHLIWPISNVQTDYNLSLSMSDLIYHSALPEVLCLHSTCIPGKQIERIARKQSIRNPYGITCPTMFSKINEFKNLKIDQHMSSTEFHAKHVFSCVEDMEVIDQTRYDYSFIFRMVHYNLKSL